MNRAHQVEYEILKLCKRYTHAQPYGTARPDLAKFITKTIPGPGNADTEVVDALKRLHENRLLELTKYNHVHQQMLSYADYGGNAFFYGEGGDGSDLSINWTHKTQPYYEELKFAAEADEPKPPIEFRPRLWERDVEDQSGQGRATHEKAGPRAYWRDR